MTRLIVIGLAEMGVKAIFATKPMCLSLAQADAMIEAGWVDEVLSLLDSGYGPELPSMSSVGYGELARHLNGDLSLEDAVERIKGRTHKFARHQYAWFRSGDERIRWFDAETGLDDAEQEVVRWLETAGHKQAIE